MHFHVEVIVPPTANIVEAVSRVMQFNENDNERHGFYDWYVVGGRWSGEKLLCGLDQAKLDEFGQALKQAEVMVSGMQCGKQEIVKPEQVEYTDALWREMFPGKGEHCPLFAHYNDQYANDPINVDVCRVKDIPDGLTCEALLIGSVKTGGVRECEYLLRKSIWNGVVHQDTTWDGSVKKALQMYADMIKDYREEYRETRRVKDDWLCVTVDCHV